MTNTTVKRTPTSAPNQDTEIAKRQRGVLLVNVGTPDSPDVAGVRRYLAEFLSDPLVIQLPLLMRWLQRPLARLIAWRRAPQSAEKYKLIWTDRGSPLRTIMQDQAAALAQQLPDDWDVFLGMRYGAPSIADALAEIARREITELVVVPLYPQFSRTTTGTVVNEVYRVLKRDALHINVNARTTWHDDAGYLNAQARLIADFAHQRQLAPDSALLLFSAHGLPVSYIERGDPYERQLTQSVRLIAERLGWPSERYDLAYQSRMGPQEWLTPSLTDRLQTLAEAGERQVLVCPISFAADCLETLEEIHLRAAEQFDAAGGTLHVCPALNADPRFIDSMRQLVLRGPRPVVTWSRGHEPLLRPQNSASAADPSLDRLVMIGVSMENRVGSGRGPDLAYSDADGLACAKKSHADVESFLSSLRTDANVREAFVWNTCYRFECYVWLESSGRASSECAVAAVRRALFAQEGPGVRVNVLFGRNAWHHLARTIAGLNSGLPGDKDIVAQFRTAFQAAERAQTAGPRAEALVQQAIALAEEVRQETDWGRLDPGYCHAALAQVQAQLPRRLANLRHVVVGGSTTSRSVLDALYTHFDVKEPNVTLVYRTHQGGQMKLLRKAVGRGRRLRVQAYTEPSVQAAIADADVVYFGIDRAEPVLDADAVRALRDLTARPLHIVDFNTAGSTTGLESTPGVRIWTAPQLDIEVAAFADALCGGEEFPRIVSEAEAWIEQRVPAPVAPSVEFPCQHRDDQGHPNCARCGRLLEQAGGRSVG
jgi:ferrochelatase